MNILKALEKRQIERASKKSDNKKKVISAESDNVMPFEKADTQKSLPEIFTAEEFSIGTPDSAFDQQSNSLIGTGLHDLKTKGTTEATLNAGGLTYCVSKSLPEFARWEVETERVEPRLVAITQPNSNYCEEYRSLRTHILHKSQRQKMQAIVVASVNPAEGKSVTALNLSWLLAQTDGVKALVIDSDLRMPSLNDYIGIETEKGLSDLLAGTATLSNSIIELAPSGLHLLPSGEARSDVAELISGPKFKDILDEAREMFDYIIIDAPPLGIFTDATVLINNADGAMLVVRAGRTKYAGVDRILEILPRERMIGVVLNQCEDVMPERQYGYGYYNTYE